MPIIESLLEGFNLNRREMYQNPPLDSGLFAGNRLQVMPPDITDQIPLSEVNQQIPNSSLDFSKLTIDRLFINQNIQSSNFATGSTGWQIKGNGDVEFNSGTFRGTVSAGTFIGGSIHIPDQNTTAASFHTNSLGKSWWGCTETNFTSNNDNAAAYILATGVAKFQSVTLSSNVVLSGLQSGSSIDGTYLGNATVTGGKIASATITGSNIGSATITGSNLAATTITATNIANLTITASQIASLTITAGQIADSTVTGTKVATNTITGGGSGNLALTTITAANIVANTITASQISAGTITATEIAASTITAGKLSISQLSAISADMGAITAGTINLSSGSANIRSGQTAYNTGAGFWLEYNSGTPRFSIGDGTVANSLTWDGSTLKVNGRQFISDPIFGDGSDGALIYYADATLTRDIFPTTLTLDAAPTAAPFYPATGTSGDGYAGATATNATFQNLNGLSQTVNFNTASGTSGDGYAGTTGTNAVFGTLRATAGTESDSSATTEIVEILSGTTASRWNEFRRFLMSFDTSPIPATATVSAATLNIWPDSKVDNYSQSLSLVLPSSAAFPIANGSYNNANWTMTQQASDLTVAGLTTGATNTFTLNGTGLGNVVLAGTTYFGIVMSSDRSNSAPAWISATAASVTLQTAENTHGPQLGVTYTSGVAGTESDSSATTEICRIVSGNSSNGWNEIRRIILNFDTSAIPVGVTITAATLQVYVTAVTNNFSQSLSLVQQAGGVIGNSSYNTANWTMTQQASDISLGSLSTSAYNTFTLNGTGLANITKAGTTKFGIVMSSDRTGTPPTWASSTTASATIQTIEGANPPKLLVTWTGGSVTLNPSGYRVLAKTSISVKNGAKISVNGSAGGNGGNGGAATSIAVGAAGSAGSAGAALPSGSIAGSVAGIAGTAGTAGAAGRNTAGIGNAASSPSNAGNGNAAANSLGAASVAGVAGVAGGGGGSAGANNGGASASPGSGGSAGSFTAAISSVRVSVNAVSMVDTGSGTGALYKSSPSAGGAGGGAGGGGGGAVATISSGTSGYGGGGGGGGGGGSAGGLMLLASPTITVDATSSITANGGAGGNGGNAGAGAASTVSGTGAGGGGAAGGAGGAGAGGNGGAIVLIYTTYTNSGTVTASAGSVGSVGAGALGAVGSGTASFTSGNPTSAGSAPSAAAAGSIVQLQLS